MSSDGRRIRVGTINPNDAVDTATKTRATMDPGRLDEGDVALLYNATSANVSREEVSAAGAPGDTDDLDAAVGDMGPYGAHSDGGMGAAGEYGRVGVQAGAEGDFGGRTTMALGREGGDQIVFGERVDAEGGEVGPGGDGTGREYLRVGGQGSYAGGLPRGIVGAMTEFEGGDKGVVADAPQRWQQQE